MAMRTDQRLAALVKRKRDEFVQAVAEAVEAGLDVEIWGIGDETWTSGQRGALDLGVSVTKEL